MEQITRAYNFKFQAESSDNTLRQYLKLHETNRDNLSEKNTFVASLYNENGLNENALKIENIFKIENNFKVENSSKFGKEVTRMEINGYGEDSNKKRRCNFDEVLGKSLKCILVCSFCKESFQGRFVQIL